MGRRSAGETLARILIAFTREPVWPQDELARHCEVDARALRARLLDLQGAGFPVRRDPEPPRVFWTVSTGWFPGGRVLSTSEAKLAARLVRRLPEGAAQSRVLGALQGGAASDTSGARTRDAHERHLELLEDALQERHAVEVEYFTASRGVESKRTLSIHRIVFGDRVRVVATSHDTGEVKYFRADRFRSVRTNSSEAFRAAAADDVENLLRTSVNGYRAPADAVLCRFTIRMPEARWIRTNLPVAPFTEEQVDDGIRFEVHTAGVDVLARFVVSLGVAATAETEELRRAVVELALGALERAGVKGKKKPKALTARRKPPTE